MVSVRVCVCSIDTEFEIFDVHGVFTHSHACRMTKKISTKSLGDKEVIQNIQEHTHAHNIVWEILQSHQKYSGGLNNFKSDKLFDFYLILKCSSVLCMLSYE